MSKLLRLGISLALMAVVASRIEWGALTGAFAALHLSSAEAGEANVLLTTDDRFIKRAGRRAGSPRVRVVNPVEWLREQEV